MQEDRAGSANHDHEISRHGAHGDGREHAHLGSWARGSDAVWEVFGGHSHGVAAQVDEVLEADARGCLALWVSKTHPRECCRALSDRRWQGQAVVCILQPRTPGYDRQIAFLERIWFGGGREWLGERVAGRVLEVGIGTGRNLQHYPGSIDLSAIELRPAMLNIARRHAGELGRTVDLREGDAAQLPWDDATFDTVVCALCLYSIPDPAVAIGEMRRVLRPGGHLLLLDHVGSTSPVLRGLQWLVERATIPVMGEHFTRRQLPLVERAGFSVETSERRKLGTIVRIDAIKVLGL